MRNSVTLLLLLALCGSAQSTIVRFETNVGDFEVLMFEDVAPNTVANFMSYVESGSYDGTIVHRNVPDFVIQGGGYDEELERITTDAPILNEFATSNTRGTIAMAKTSDPDSATNQWFINIADNTFLDSPSNSGGFTVFGEILGDGMDVVDLINQLPTDASNGGPFRELPLVSTDIDSFVVVSRVHAVPEPSSLHIWLLVIVLQIARMRRTVFV